jgi:hypothetical protein
MHKRQPRSLSKNKTKPGDCVVSHSVSLQCAVPRRASKWECRMSTTTRATRRGAAPERPTTTTALTAVDFFHAFCMQTTLPFTHRTCTDQKTKQRTRPHRTREKVSGYNNSRARAIGFRAARGNKNASSDAVVTCGVNGQLSSVLRSVD